MSLSPYVPTQTKLRFPSLKTAILLLSAITFVIELVLLAYWVTQGVKGTGHLLLPSLAIIFSMGVFIICYFYVDTAIPQHGQHPPLKDPGQEKEKEQQGENTYQPGGNGVQPPSQPAEDIDQKTVVIDKPLEVIDKPPRRYKQYAENEARCFIVPKEGNDPERSDDKYAMKKVQEYSRYAVADGVSTSFQPARWAKVLVDSYVDRRNDFVDQQDFNNWLKSCSTLWEQRVRNEWLRFVKLSPWEDPDTMIAQGAQSTFIGCTLRRGSDEKTYAHILAVGDANFFQFRLSPQGMTCIAAYPQTQVERSSFTDTLTSIISDRKLLRAWQACKIPPHPYPVLPGDYLVFTTDEMAIWLLKRKERDLKELLIITDEQVFQKFVEDQRRDGLMELDDTTMLIIPFLLDK